jgi:hypothetical protein
MSTCRPAVKWLATASFLIGTLAPITADRLGAVIQGGRRTAGPVLAGAAIDRGAPGAGAVDGVATRSPRSERILRPERATSTEQSRPTAGRYQATEPANVDPDASDPALRRAQLAALAARPFLQRLPYRDRDVGVSLDTVTPRGTPVLLVTFLGTLPAARRDMRAVLARSHDAGSEYELRFERLLGN